MSSVGDSPARTSASPGPEADWPASDPGCGPNTCDSFASYDPDTSSWRTSQRSWLEGWERFSATWPRAGMTRSGTASQLKPLAPTTREIASGLWPTPTVNGNYNRKGASATSGDGLATAVRRWPTPTARDYRSPGTPERLARAKRESSRGQPLTEEVGGQLNPTWVEWLMGYPTGWTELKDWGTASSRRSRSGSAVASSKRKVRK